MTLPTTRVTLHIFPAGCTEDFSGWPSEISNIYRTLGLPLPSWCATGPHFPPTTEKPRLADVFNLVVSTVTDIQSLVALYGPSRSPAPFVLPLLSILARICAQEAMIITEAPFVRPRTKTPDSDDFEGIATMLACHVFDGDVPEDPRPLGSVPTSSDAESDPPPRLSFNGPLGAHILPGRGVHTCAALPFLCVADQDNIADLMGSVTCQRQVWGIPFPVVGFVLSGTVMTLVLSWFDPDTSTVHIVPSVSNGGVFDLTDTDSVLSLAQFILNLSPHFACVLKCAKERLKLGFGNNTLDWRSDNILPSHESGNLRDRVVQWLRHVEMPASPLSPPTIPPSTEMPPEDLDKNQTSDQPENPPARSETQSTSKHLSSSAYAARSTFGLDEDDGQLSTWMFDRFVQPIARISFDNATTEQQKEINAKIKSYNDMCGLQRLDDLETFPDVDRTVSSVRDVLLSRLSELLPRSQLHEEHLSDDEEDLSDDEEDLPDVEEDLPILPAPHRAILLAHLSALLSAAIGAYIVDHKRREDVPVYEAESRYHWDSLLYHFYCLATDNISPYVMLEHVIHYPRNDLADKFDSAALNRAAQMKLIQAQASRMEASGNLCTAATQSAARMFVAPDVLETAIAATNQATRMYTTMVGFTKKPGQFRETVNTRSNLEPTQGKCDAMLFMAIPIPTGSNLSKGLEMIRHLDSSPPGSSTGSGVPSGQGSPADDGVANLASIGAATPVAISRDAGTSSQTGKRSDKVANVAAPGEAQGAAAGGSKAQTERGKGGGSTQGATTARRDEGRLRNLFAAPEIALPVPEHPLNHFNLAKFKGHLLLPHSPAEYKKHADSETKALNQGRLYLISVVSFYAAMGIEDYPFYDTVTAGKRGAILMAWKSKSETKPDPASESRPQIYLMERNVCTLDISNPLEAYQYATFLIRLREDQEVLKKRVEEILAADAEGAVARIQRWRKSAQETLYPVKKKETKKAQKAAAKAEKAPVSPRLPTVPEVQENTTL
ncbi:hypothetical protein B0H12DRAFT_1320184 [Mycena haematopus]|nr:hypothetical protein B0H12DRAFT_1320184 [Mycena haematopus]